VIEVKSTLKASHYKALVEAARRLAPDNPSGLRIATPGTLEGNETIYPLCTVFGYTADAGRDEFERLDEQVPGGSRYIRLVGVLDKGAWSLDAGAQLKEDAGENAVRFLALLLNKLEDTAHSRGRYRLQDWLL
jgi:hypothetical protein